MTHYLPPEILDLIVDHLHGEPTTLRACCLISKSWVPRSRMHLFAHVKFAYTSIESWMKAFPDPLNSPAHYARALTIHDPQLVAVAGPVVAHRICAFQFHNIVDLNIQSNSLSGYGDDRISLAPFHGLSPTTRSLRLALYVRPSEVLDIVCSFPLLEDFTLLVLGYGSKADEWTPPPTSPRLTGSLELRSMIGGIDPITRRLLDLPNGLNFTKIVLSCLDDGKIFKSITDLVSRCSGTLESLDVSDRFPGNFPSFPAPHSRLITAPSPVHGDFVQPLYGNETQTLGI